MCTSADQPESRPGAEPPPIPLADDPSAYAIGLSMIAQKQSVMTARMVGVMPETLYDQDDQPFVPKCLDCGYSLAGVSEGPCPECGLRFTAAGLAKHARSKRLSREQGLGFIKGLVLPVFLFASLFGGGIDTNGGAATFVLVIGLLAALCIWLGRHVLRANSFVWLIALLPITTLSMGMLTSATPTPWLIGLGCVSVVVAWLALRNSPLVSAVAVLILYVLPSVFFGIVIHLHAKSRLANGHFWTDFDRPTPTGWKALSAPDAVNRTFWMTYAGIAVGVVVILYSRRAFNRLKGAKRGGANAAKRDV